MELQKKELVKELMGENSSISESRNQVESSRRIALSPKSSSTPNSPEKSR